jgi:hypothetical protein
MATPTCLKCGGTQFEHKEVSLKRFRPKLTFVQCSSCGGVVGVLDHSMAEELREMRKTLERIASCLF